MYILDCRKAKKLTPNVHTVAKLQLAARFTQ